MTGTCKVKRNYLYKVFILFHLGPKREKVTVERRKLHKEELNVLYSSPNIFGVINSRRMKLA
jgi:hypothetical protein